MTHDASDATMNCTGGGGALLVSGWAVVTDGAASPTCTLTFQTRKIGATTISIAPSEVNSFAGEPLSCGSASKKISVVAAPTLSEENRLSALSVSTGEMTPAFAEETRDYAMTVPFETTSLILSATPKDAKAAVAISSADALVVGENKIEIVVTAENGSTRTYTLTVTRARSELAGVTAELDGTVYTVSHDPATLTVPEGYTATTALLGEKKILAYASAKETILISHLYHETASGWYVFDEESQSFTPYLPVLTEGKNMVILTPEESIPVPEGFLPHELEIGESRYHGYKASNSEEEGVFLVYAMTPDGNCAFYYFDTALRSFTSYFLPAGDTAAEEAAAKENAILESLAKENEEKADQMEIIALAVAVLAAILLVALIISLVARKRKAKADFGTEEEIAKKGESSEPIDSEVNVAPIAPAEPSRPHRRARRTLEELGKSGGEEKPIPAAEVPAVPEKEEQAPTPKAAPKPAPSRGSESFPGILMDD